MTLPAPTEDPRRLRPTLAFDASGPVVSAAAWADGDPAIEAADAGQHGSRVLHELGVRALERAGVSIGDLRSVAAACGPGSFTGLRVALASASGLAMALGVPAFGVTTTAAAALAAAATLGLAVGAQLAVVLDGGHGRTYVALHEITAEGVLELRPVEDATAVGAAAIATLHGAQLVVFGAPSGLEALLGAGGVRVQAPLAGAVARLVVTDAARPGLEPLYVRPPSVRPKT